MRFDRVGWVLAGFLAAVAFGPRVVAQNVRQEPDVLGALLVEVRGLRQAMEQMASAGPRVQLALGRLQLQEQRVNTMLRRLETVREQVGDSERGVSQTEADFLRIQEGIRNTESNTTIAPKIREERLIQLNQELSELKRAASIRTGELQRVQGEAATLEQQIANEQGRWSEINRALEELERALGKRGGL